MKTTKILVAFIFFIFASAFQTVAFAEIPPFNEIVVFGDSLSDNGNLYKIDFGYMPKSPPYYKGMFSNGEVWTTYVKDHLKSKHISIRNYALGGLTTVLRNPIEGYAPFTLNNSVYEYLAGNFLHSKEKTLFIIWVGSNDYLPGAPKPDRQTAEVIDTIKQAVMTLIHHGAKNFMILNLPELSLTPYSRNKNMGPELSRVTKLHNEKLAKAVTELTNEYKKVNIHLFDIHALLVSVLTNVDSSSINITEACWTGGYTLNRPEVNPNTSAMAQELQEKIATQLKMGSPKTPQERGFDSEAFASFVAQSPSLREAYQISQGVGTFGQPIKPCSNPDEHVFWDHIHPTGVIHRLLGGFLGLYIDQNYKVS